MRSLTRRGVLLTGLGTAGVAVLGGCGRHTAGAATPAAPAGPTAGGAPSTADLGAAIERLAATAYAVLDARLALGVLGPPSAAVAALLPAVRAAHEEAAVSWEALRAVDGGTPALRSGAALLSPVGGAVSTGAGLRALAAVERTAAATYLQQVGLPVAAATPTADETAARMLAVRLATRTAQHAAVLATLLGSAPAPDAFLSLDGALGTGAITP